MVINTVAGDSPYHNLAMLMILDTGGASRYWLGRILVMERKSTPEAEQLLALAASQVPEARLCRAQIFQNRGEIGDAMSELRAYLQVCPADKRDKVKSWLAQLASVVGNQNAPRGEHQGN